MGTAEEQTPSKPAKAASSQETPTMPPFSDWSSPMQAYYGTSTPPFFASAVASPPPHPYMWGVQPPMMPPYGTPVHYPAMYSPGAVYAHPNIGMPANPASAVESEGKNSDLKDQNSSKKSKVNSVVGDEKAAESAKAASGSGNDAASQSSVDSGSEGSSDASDENNNQQDFSVSKKGSFDQMLVDGANAQNNVANPSIQGTIPGKPVVSTPATALNGGMDLWNDSHANSVKLRPNTGVSSAFAPAMSDHQFMDERELKRQKRKQSNRESARRSRLRKQAECEELQKRVESLSSENNSLRDEMTRLGEECRQLESENDSIKEELTRLCGPDALSRLEERKLSGEGKS